MDARFSRASTGSTSSRFDSFLLGAVWLNLRYAKTKMSSTDPLLTQPAATPADARLAGRQPAPLPHSGSLSSRASPAGSQNGNEHAHPPVQPQNCTTVGIFHTPKLDQDLVELGPCRGMCTRPTICQFSTVVFGSRCCPPLPAQGNLQFKGRTGKGAQG